MAESRYYVGIDLGMTNSVMAYVDNEGLHIQQWEGGHSKFPSVVMITPRGRYAGYSALKRMEIENKYAIQSNFKRMLGTDHVQTVYEVDYSITELFAMILRRMCDIFNKEHDYRIEKAIIAVPADFGDAERQAIFKVAELAGIKEPVVINESDAAAIAYCYDTEEFKGNIAIYDIGGGTFDVTIITVDNEGFTVVYNEGSKYLGGRDWDLHLASIIQKKIASFSDLSPEEIDRNHILRRDILNEAERLKIVLDRVDKGNGSVQLNGTVIGFTVTRNELDNATKGLIERTIAMTRSAIEGSGINKVDRIVMVGGPSITPSIRNMLEESFPDVDIIRYDPLHAVARGAAIYARSFFDDNVLNLTPILNKTYGVKMGVDGQEKICNVIYRNTPLPLKRKMVCRPKADDQKELDISVYDTRADSSIQFSDVDSARLINSFTLPLSGRISRGKTKIEIAMSADLDGTVSLTVECNGVTHECNLGKDIQMTDDEMIESMRKVMSVQ